jgi:hypothetical protein
MDSDSDALIHKLPDQTFAASQAAHNRGVCYVAPASDIDVMFDQLEYLLAHQNNGCPAGCQDCLRLKQVKVWLLQPFRPATAILKTPASRRNTACRTDC